MKKLIVSLIGVCLLFTGTRASAQISASDGTWSFGGGFSGFTLGGADADAVKRLGFENMIPGFYFGVNFDYAFSSIDGLTLEPGVNIFHYGKAFTFGLAEDHKSYHANYLQIPVNIKFAFPMDSSPVGMAVYTGPRLNIGIGGNMFSTGKTYPGLKPIDAQWGFGLSVALAEAVALRGEYNISLTNCLRDNKEFNFDDEIIRRNSFSIGVSFMFK